MSGPDRAPDVEPATFAAPPFDMLTDLVGDAVRADLVVLMAGNQYMVVPDLLASFRAVRPDVREVYYETLPPGVIIEQLRRGALRVGTLTLRVVPDVIAAGPAALDALERDGLTGPHTGYASNDLALLVAAGNPHRITGLADLGRDRVRVAVPDPDTEGIGRRALASLQRAGGPRLRDRVAIGKRGDGTAVFTTIHHRQSPAWLADRRVDAAFVWSTEARYHERLGVPVETVPIPPEHNVTGGYAAAVVGRAAHPAAAAAFVAHLAGPAGREVYARYGFARPPG